MLSCSQDGKRESEWHHDYNRRCALLREELEARQAVLAWERREWELLWHRCINEDEEAWAQEETRRRMAELAALPTPISYNFQFRAGATRSILPPGVKLNAVRCDSLECTTCPHVETERFLAWEEENRADLVEWESAEWNRMSEAMTWILMEQRKREREMRERICKRVLKGATALDWFAYPRYGRLEAVSK